MSVALMTLDQREHHTDTLRSALSVLIYPIQALVGLPANTGNWVAEQLSSRETLIDENKALHDENFQLKIKLQKYEALEAENNRLRELLGSSFRVGEKTLIAELIGVDMIPFSQQLLLNKGKDHDIYSGQPILDATGVMGQVLKVGPISSTAIMITDPSHEIPIEINRNGLRAIARGTGDTSQLDVPHVPNNADIVVGDLLVTSGLGGRFPPGYPVAKVTSVTSLPGEPFANITAEPTAKLLSTREVLLVWVKQPDTTFSDTEDTQP